MARLGESPEVRNLRRAQNSFSTWATFTVEDGRSKARAVLLDFLRVSALNFDTLKAFESY